MNGVCYQLPALTAEAVSNSGISVLTAEEILDQEEFNALSAERSLKKGRT